MTTRLREAILLLLPAQFVAAPMGIHRFERINEHLYRGGQPAEAGFQALAKIGIHTIVDLREKTQKALWEKRIVESLGMRFVAVPMSMHAPTDEQIARVLALFNATEDGPVFVHCQGGRDRTGAVIACYRIAHDGWSNLKAFEEAKQHGISMFDVGLRNYILNYRKPTRTPAA